MQKPFRSGGMGESKNSLYGFIPKSMGFSQSLSKIMADGNILSYQISGKSCDT
jgi:hypothetical protein